MIDLYRRLGARGPADSTAIEQALQDPEHPAELRRLGAFVLGDLERREVHDAAWKTLSVAARLRAAFLLEMTPLWRTSAAEEFSSAATDPTRTAQCLPIDRDRDA